jgi:hypothetical protein
MAQASPLNMCSLLTGANYVRVQPRCINTVLPNNEVEDRGRGLQSILVIHSLYVCEFAHWLNLSVIP